MRSYRRRIRGFTFIESLFSVFLVSIAALILSASMPVATAGRSKASYMNKAASYAQKQMEAIRAQGYANITADKLAAAGILDSATPITTSTYNCTSSDTDTWDNVARLLPTGTSSVKIEQADIELRRITVTVKWKERGQVKTFQMGTLVANL